MVESCLDAPPSRKVVLQSLGGRLAATTVGQFIQLAFESDIEAWVRQVGRSRCEVGVC